MPFSRPTRASRAAGRPAARNSGDSDSFAQRAPRPRSAARRAGRRVATRFLLGALELRDTRLALLTQDHFRVGAGALRLGLPVELHACDCQRRRRDDQNRDERFHIYGSALVELGCRAYLNKIRQPTQRPRAAHPAGTRRLGARCNVVGYTARVTARPLVLIAATFVATWPGPPMRRAVAAWIAEKQLSTRGDAARSECEVLARIHLRRRARAIRPQHRRPPAKV